MAGNISKYIQLNDFLLLEYEFNRGDTPAIMANYGVGTQLAGSKQLFAHANSETVTNNSLKLQSIPTNTKRSSWFINTEAPGDYGQFTSEVNLGNILYLHDTVKVHIISGYNFDDIPGFLLQIRAEDASGAMVDISNFTWLKQVLGSTQVVKFSSSPLFLGNKFYDKYIEFRVPSIQSLGGDTAPPLGQTLNIKPASDVHIQYSTIIKVNEVTDGNQYVITEKIVLQLPVVSNADNFNCFIAESTAGDYIEYYATWGDIIIGEYIEDIESGKIPLYTSNNPNDNFQDFATRYGFNASKWVIIHELQVFEHIPPGTDLMTQRFSFTQEDNFLTPNKFRPVIVNADIASSYTINYICRLSNRMDGSQIIRQASFSSTDTNKYGRFFQRINVDNFIPLKVFNRLPDEKPNITIGSGVPKVKFVKVFYNVTKVVLSRENEVMPQGTGPLFLTNGDSVYKLKFERLNDNTETTQLENVDLSGAYDYALLFVLDDLTRIEVPPTYSNNMNTTLGELEFKINGDQVKRLLAQEGNTYSVVVKNPDGSEYTFYQGQYFSKSRSGQAEIAEVAPPSRMATVNREIARLEAKIRALEDENARIKRESR